MAILLIVIITTIAENPAHNDITDERMQVKSQSLMFAYMRLFFFFSFVPRPSGKMAWYSEWHFLPDGVGILCMS